MCSELCEKGSMLLYSSIGSLLPCLSVSLVSLEAALEGDYRFWRFGDVMTRDKPLNPLQGHSTTGTIVTSRDSTVHIL